MDLVISRFPHIGENILGNLDNESLVNCKEVGRALSKFLEEEKIVWIREIRNYTNQYQNKKFRESWRLVIQKTSSELIKQLATLLKDSLYKDENQKMYGDERFGYIKRVIVTPAVYPHLDESLHFDIQSTWLLSNLCGGKRLWSPLHIAVEAGHLDLCKSILGRAKIKNPKDIEHWTPLHSAAMFGHFEIWQMIFKRVKNKNPPTKSLKITPLHLAAQSGHLEICKAIMEKLNKIDHGPENHDGNTPFHLAAKEGHLEVCLAILDAEKNKTRKYNFGIFLEAYCDIMANKYDKGSLRDFSGDTPLHIAAFKGHLTIVKELIANLGYKHLKGTGDFTPLHAAACNGHFKVCLEIMKNIEDKNPQDTRGTTPLHYAAYHGHLQICEAIMDELTDKNPSNKLGLTPMDMAKFTFQIDVVEAIENKMKMEMREHQK